MPRRPGVLRTYPGGPCFMPMSRRRGVCGAIEVILAPTRAATGTDISP